MSQHLDHVARLKLASLTRILRQRDPHASAVECCHHLNRAAHLVALILQPVHVPNVIVAVLAWTLANLDACGPRLSVRALLFLRAC
jgi:hypothetical protein